VTGAAALLLAVVAAAAPESAPPDSQARFSAALARAKADLSTPAGHDYDRVLSGFFRQHNATILSACFRSIPAPDKRAFELVFRVERGGAVGEALAWPETNIGLCLLDGLKAATFPPPPWDSYWAQQRTNFGQ